MINFFLYCLNYNSFLTVQRSFCVLSKHNPLFMCFAGHFGTGVLSYFIFLKWLFQLNCAIFGLVFLFIVVPQLALNTAADPTYNEPCQSCKWDELFS